MRLSAANLSLTRPQRGPVTPPWFPADVTLTNAMTLEWFDADGTVYAEAGATPAALATANLDPVGAWPSGRGANIAGRAYPLHRAAGDNMTYAPTLLVGDATHNRAIRFTNVDQGLYPSAASANTYNRGTTTHLNAFRIRVNAAPGAGKQWGIWQQAANGAPPCLGLRAADGEWGGRPNDAVTTLPFVGGVFALGQWETIVEVADATGTTYYRNNRTTPSATVPGMTPTGLDVASFTFLSSPFWYDGLEFDIYRCVLGADIDLAEVSIPGLMAWLEGA